MKTRTPIQATEEMFFLNKKTETVTLKDKEKSIRFESQSPIIESIIELIIEPIVYKC